MQRGQNCPSPARAACDKARSGSISSAAQWNMKSSMKAQCAGQKRDVVFAPPPASYEPAVA